jgi:metal-sulfur cluster biosynthetic enzyme
MRKKLYQIAMRKIGFIPPAAAALHWKKIDIGVRNWEPEPGHCGGNQMPTVTEEDVLSALRSCYDPEIPVNIVDLGLIYGVNFASVAAEPPEETKQDVTIDMTLTAQGCPEHVNISAQVKSRLEQLPGIRNAEVNVVWTPPWTPERLSPDARKQLGIE